MAYTTYHSLTGPQGRAYRGYQGTRYETPIAQRSTFETQGSMPMAAQTADDVAQKEVAESPSPIDAIRDLAVSEGAPTEGMSLTTGDPLSQSIVSDAVTDVGTTAGFNALANSSIAALLGAPTAAAAKYGMSSIMGPLSGAGYIGKTASAGLDAVDAVGRMDTYGYDVNDLDPARMDSYSATMAEAIDAGVPSAAQADIRADYGPEGFAMDTKQALEDRGIFTAIRDRLATLGGMIGDGSSTRTGTFDNGIRMHEDLAKKYSEDPTFAPLLGNFTPDAPGGGNGEKDTGSGFIGAHANDYDGVATGGYRGYDNIGGYTGLDSYSVDGPFGPNDTLGGYGPESDFGGMNSGGSTSGSSTGGYSSGAEASDAAAAQGHDTDSQGWW